MRLEAHILRFHCQTQTELAASHYKGSMLRGALFAALRHDFCMVRGSSWECLAPQIRQVCPVCCLLATADEGSTRGMEVARPCAIEPPLDVRTQYGPGYNFSFGVTLFGDAANLLPYVILGVERMGQRGIGNRQRAPGQFTLRRVEAVDPISGASQQVYDPGQRLARQPQSAVAHQDILAAAARLGTPVQVALEFLTPTRLIAGEALVKELTFPLLLRRLLRRLTDLTRTATGTLPDFDHEELLALAPSVQVVEDRTRWLDVPSHSARLGRFTPIGGLTGEITLAGELTPFVPWLLWGAITHIGKDATKGGGWYRLRWQN